MATLVLLTHYAGKPVLSVISMCCREPDHVLRYEESERPISEVAVRFELKDSISASLSEANHDNGHFLTGKNSSTKAVVDVDYANAR